MTRDRVTSIHNAWSRETDPDTVENASRDDPYFIKSLTGYIRCIHIQYVYVNGHRFANRYKDTVHTQVNTRIVSHSIWLVIVVPHKGIEGTKLHPTYTQLLSGVAFKATDVCPHQWHPKQAELQHSWGEGQVQKVSLNL